MRSYTTIEYADPNTNEAINGVANGNNQVSFANEPEAVNVNLAAGVATTTQIVTNTVTNFAYSFGAIPSFLLGGSSYNTGNAAIIAAERILGSYGVSLSSVNNLSSAAQSAFIAALDNGQVSGVPIGSNPGNIIAGFQYLGETYVEYAPIVTTTSYNVSTTYTYTLQNIDTVTGSPYGGTLIAGAPDKRLLPAAARLR